MRTTVCSRGHVYNYLFMSKRILSRTTDTRQPNKLRGFCRKLTHDFKVRRPVIWPKSLSRSGAHISSRRPPLIKFYLRFGAHHRVNPTPVSSLKLAIVRDPRSLPGTPLRPADRRLTLASDHALSVATQNSRTTYLTLTQQPPTT